MENDDLATYLNDHLAGSVGAIELIGNLIRIYEGNPMEEFYKELCADVSSDQDELRDLMGALKVKESSMRKASAWVAEKLSRPKLEPSSDGASGVGLLQALESLVLGIR